LRCYFLARPVPGVGILLLGLVPAAVAAILALIFAPSEAAPVAYIAGVAGPLIGADLLHLKDIERSAVGMASIGGAGTFGTTADGTRQGEKTDRFEKGTHVTVGHRSPNAIFCHL
jgi:uncharacterized membrane protein